MKQLIVKLKNKTKHVRLLLLRTMHLISNIHSVLWLSDKSWLVFVSAGDDDVLSSTVAAQ